MSKFIALVLCLIFGCKAMSGAPPGVKSYGVIRLDGPEKVRSPLCDCGETCACETCVCNTVPQKPKIPEPVTEFPAVTTTPATDAKVAPKTEPSARPQQQTPAGRWETYRGRWGRRYQRWVPANGLKPVPAVPQAPAGFPVPGDFGTVKNSLTVGTC